jgi:small-conductance mechanosensitive channel/CRP-like cAMP-binding protein
MGELIRTWAIALAVAAALQLLARICRQRRLGRPPIRLPLVAITIWALLRTLPVPSLPGAYRPWLFSLDDLLLAYALVGFVVWLGLVLPGELHWWRRPPKLLLQLLTLGGWGLATVVVLRSTTRFDLVGLITTSAVLTAVIGLAAQEPLKDLLAGLELQLSDDFKPGDWLVLKDDVRGIVQSVSWHDTTLRNLDGALVVVPNTEVAQGVVFNMSHQGPVTNRFSIGLDYDYPPGQARRLLESVVRQHPRVLEDPAPDIRLKSFDDSSIAYEIHVWQSETGDLAMLRLRSELLEQIWYALRREGQSIPFPIRELQPRRRRPPAEGAVDLRPEALQRALGQDGIFSDLTPEQLRSLVEGSALVFYGPGEAIVQEGKDGESMYHLMRGSVEVLKWMAPDRSVAVRRLGPGDVFGEMTLFLDAPRSATVRALEECALLKVNRRCVRGLLEESPELLERVAAMVSARQAELEHLGRERQEEQTNALLMTMKRLFFALKGR